MSSVMKKSFVYAKLVFGCELPAILYKELPARIPQQYVLADVRQADETAGHWSHRVQTVSKLSLLLKVLKTTKFGKVA